MQTTEAHELELSNHQIAEMILKTTPPHIADIRLDKVIQSDSYGQHLHRTWVFTGGAIGSIERYWGGLKMICSVLGGSPRTSFFTEDGTKTTNKGLKGL